MKAIRIVLAWTEVVMGRFERNGKSEDYLGNKTGKFPFYLDKESEKEKYKDN